MIYKILLKKVLNEILIINDEKGEDFEYNNETKPKLKNLILKFIIIKICLNI